MTEEGPTAGYVSQTDSVGADPGTQPTAHAGAEPGTQPGPPPANYRGPEPRELLHQGTPVTPRPAATVLLLRGGEQTLELLMVRRHPQARFMAGVWVFPGGAVDASDGAGSGGVRAAAIRELREESGIAITDPETLVEYSRWITPREVSVRFDTWFFLAPAPTEQRVVLSPDELVDHRWITPAEALAAHRSGEMSLVFPTIRTLESLLDYESARAAITANRGRAVEPREPRMVGNGGKLRITLPGDPGYPGS